MDRKLASIQTVDKITPIPNADRIETLHVLGWTVVAPKGQFQVGDKCVYCEVDSVLPERPEFEYMRPMKFRVRTLKMRSQLSQGVCFKPEDLNLSDLPKGSDVTEQLGIVKYERPIKMINSASGDRPSNPRPHFVPKTDEFRLQSYPELLDEFGEQLCYITTKLDGTSMSVFWYQDRFGVCSRNRLAFEDEMYYEPINRMGLNASSFSNIILQGELVGPGIQKNPLGLDKLSFFVFNILTENGYLGYDDMISFLEDNPPLRGVPVDEAYIRIDKLGLVGLLEMAQGFYHGTKHPREGIVVRTIEPKLSSVLDGNLMSFKVHNPDYLLKER